MGIFRINGKRFPKQFFRFWYPIGVLEEDCEIVFTSTGGRMLLVHTGALNSKTTKDTIGVSVMTLKKNHHLDSMHFYREGEFDKAWRFRAKNLPAAGAVPGPADNSDQISF